jgi:hypothetical protein
MRCALCATPTTPHRPPYAEELLVNLDARHTLVRPDDDAISSEFKHDIMVAGLKATIIQGVT